MTTNKDSKWSESLSSIVSLGFFVLVFCKVFHHLKTKLCFLVTFLELFVSYKTRYHTENKSRQHPNTKGGK
jgi:hypothetical protein